MTDTLLTSYKTCDTLETASDGDISSYKRWMEQNNPIAEPEMRFLEQDEDLVRISSSRRGASASRPGYF